MCRSDISTVASCRWILRWIETVLDFRKCIIQLTIILRDTVLSYFCNPWFCIPWVEKQKHIPQGAKPQLVSMARQSRKWPQILQSSDPDQASLWDYNREFTVVLLLFISSSFSANIYKEGQTRCYLSQHSYYPSDRACFSSLVYLKENDERSLLSRADCRYHNRWIKTTGSTSSLISEETQHERCSLFFFMMGTLWIEHLPVFLSNL